MLSHKIASKKKLVHLALLGSLHVIVYLFSIPFDSLFVTHRKSRLLRKDFFFLAEKIFILL